MKTRLTRTTWRTENSYAHGLCPFNGHDLPVRQPDDHPRRGQVQQFSQLLALANVFSHLDREAPQHTGEGSQHDLLGEIVPGAQPLGLRLAQGRRRHFLGIFCVLQGGLAGHTATRQRAAPFEVRVGQGQLALTASHPRLRAFDGDVGQ